LLLIQPFPLDRRRFYDVVRQGLQEHYFTGSRAKALYPPDEAALVKAHVRERRHDRECLSPIFSTCDHSDLIAAPRFLVEAENFSAMPLFPGPLNVRGGGKVWEHCDDLSFIPVIQADCDLSGRQRKKFSR
jgi:hypothetical protein